VAPLVAAALLGASAATAAPTCWDKAAHTVKCGTAGALPVGSSLTPDQQLDRDSRSDDLSPTQLVSLACLLGGLFALIAAMPDFDGWASTDRSGAGPSEE
jgi:uncharacterized membrane protein